MTRTTFQQHAIIQRKAINLDKLDPAAVVCAWDDCEKHGYEMYKIVMREGIRTTTFLFCTEGHRQYWANATGRNALDSADRNQGRIYGMQRPGYRRSL